MICGSWISSSSWMTAETVFLAQSDHELGQVVVADAAAKLAVERVDGGLAQGEAVDVVDGLGELRLIEQRALDLRRRSASSRS